MEFKKGVPKKKGLYVVAMGGTMALVRVASNEVGNNFAESLQGHGEWLRCPTFPASARFSPRLRQARGYSADEHTEQSLAAKLRNANVEIAKLKAERSGWKIVKSPDQIRGGKPMFNLSQAMYHTEGVVKMIEDAGCTWALDLREQERASFIATWGALFPEMEAAWMPVEGRFSRDAVEMGWKIHKACKGIS